ncbi:MAG: S8 family serine peptidase [Pseudomonadota bacterium]
MASATAPCARRAVTRASRLARLAGAGLLSTAACFALLPTGAGATELPAGLLQDQKVRGVELSDDQIQDIIAKRDPARIMHVFVRLDAPSVSELVAAAREAGSALPAKDIQRAHAKELRAQQAKMVRRIEALGGEITGSMQVGANGLRVKIARRDVASLSGLGGVMTVGEIAEHTVSNHFNSVPWISAPEIWEKLDNRGEGVTVAIIDTGIDYLHANFGGSGDPGEFAANDGTVIEPGSFPTTKVVGGWDFSGDDYDASNPATSVPMPDADPLDCNGHGSHVGGSAAGMGVGDVIGPGVAPDASLVALRVFGCAGSTLLTALAIEFAMDPDGDGDMSDAFDVINMSLGSSNGDPGDPSAIASNNAAKAGIIVVASAGNSGPLPYITGSPGVAPKAISVAASVSGGSVPGIEVSGDQSGTIEAIEGSSPVRVSDGSVSAPLVGAPVAGSGVPDGCAPFATDMTGAIALISRGGCSFAQKSANAEAQGAVGMVVYNDGTSAGRVAPISMGGLDSATIPSVMIPSFAGLGLASALTSGATISALLDASIMALTAFGDTMAGFSSQGPGSGGSGFKPDVTAPGVAITSALVGSGDGPLTISGTSMAAPHVAGAAALLRGESNRSPELIKAMMQNASVDVSTSLGAEPMTRTGVGRIDAYQTAQLSSVALPGGVSFGYVNRRKDSQISKRVNLISFDGARNFSVTHEPNQQVPGVSVDCGMPVAIAGSGRANSTTTRIRLHSDVSMMPADFGSFTQTEVDGLCIFSDGVDTLRVGYMAVVDPASIIRASAIDGGLSIKNAGETAGVVDVFTQVGGEGLILDDTSESIAAVGVRSGNPILPPGTMEFGLVTETPWESLAFFEWDIFIDEDGDGVDEAVLVVADLGLLTGQGLTGQFVTAQFDLVNGGAFLDFFVRTDFNDRVAVLPFSTTAAGGLVPESFNYTMLTFGRAGADLQLGSVDLANQLEPAADVLVLPPGADGVLPVSGMGSALLLFGGNVNARQYDMVPLR